MLTLLANLPNEFAPYVTFPVYTVISVKKNDASLLAARAFTSLSLISILASHLLSFIQSLPHFSQCLGCCERIETYLSTGPILKDDKALVTTVSNLDTPPQNFGLAAPSKATHPGTLLVSFEKVHIAWSPDSKAVFQNLTLNIRRIGPVRSGKTALVESILGEMAIREGTPSTLLSVVAYCAQRPWIINDTIRHDITGGYAFDEKWYDFCVSACALKADLMHLPEGDMHMTGSNGIALSGGQKKRVVCPSALAKHCWMR
jgi:ABC-type multidrug transport system fused ATPase/permease subunit